MRPSEGPLLVAEHLSRNFGARHAIQDISLSLHPGETVVLAGPNGAGKTTLLRCLAGLSRPTSGTVRFPGALTGDHRRQVGMVSHQTLFYDDLSLLDNLTFAAALHGVPRPGAAAARALADAGLAERSDDSPRSLSRGLAQRATIARALLHAPSLLLLDEPFTGLDHEAQRRLGATVLAGAGQGRATLLVTHQVRDAWSLASRAILLRDGRVIADEPTSGDPDAFLARHADAQHG